MQILLINIINHSLQSLVFNFPAQANLHQENWKENFIDYDWLTSFIWFSYVFQFWREIWIWVIVILLQLYQGFDWEVASESFCFLMKRPDKANPGIHCMKYIRIGEN